MIRLLGWLSLIYWWIPQANALTLGGPKGWPGIPHHSAPALKQAIGTAYESQGAASPVWFTVTQGAISEVFYPTNDQPQIGGIEFIVTDGKGLLTGQKRATLSEVSFLDDGLTVRITGKDLFGQYQYTQDIVTDPASPTLRIHTEFHWQNPDFRLFVYFKPTAGNSAVQNLGIVNREGLLAYADSSPFMYLLSSVPWLSTSGGYVGYSDGWQDLLQNFRLTESWEMIGPGNIALTGEIDMSRSADFSFDLALGFGNSSIEAHTYAQTSLSVPFEQVRELYETSWKHYLQTLESSPLALQTILQNPITRRSAILIKMHEDKKNRGAIIASLSKPVGPDLTHRTDEVGGYHLIWPRDLYHAALGLLAAGDTRTPIDVLHYFTRTQNKDGTWPESSWVNGKPYLTEVSAERVGEPGTSALPILLAGQLHDRGLYRLNNEDLEMIRKATAFLLSRGPTVSNGYSPSYLAEVIAALKTASVLIHDPMPIGVANDWQSSLEKWTLVQKADDNHYVTREGENVRVDSGFLNLVRMGIREPLDPRIINTLQTYEDPKEGLAAAFDLNYRGAMIYRRTPHSEGYLPTLAAAKGQHAVATGQIDQAREQLLLLEKTVTANLFFSEQLFPQDASHFFVRRLGVACPFVWGHAEDILLHRSIEEGTVFDAPRYR